MKVKETVNEMRNAFSKNKLTLEGIIFNEEGNPEDNGIEKIEDEPAGVPDKPEMEKPHQEEKPLGVNAPAGIQSKINAIRKLALEGVTALAEHPTTPEYDFFKKVWNMCDKAAQDGRQEREEKLEKEESNF